MNEGTTTIPTGNAGASVTPPSVTPQAGTPTPPATSTGNAGAGATPDIDWNKLDWQAHADKIPWDKAPIDKIPSVQKMQASLRRQQAESEKRAREREQILQEQLNQYQQLIAGQDPELAQRMQGVNQQAETLRMQQQLDRYQEIEARKLMAERYQVPEEIVFGFQGGPEEVMAQVLDYQSMNRVETQNTLQKQLAEMQAKLDALTRRSSDPAANQDVSVAAPSGSHYQNEWERLTKEGRGDEASRLYREALTKGLTINRDITKPKHWA